MAKEQQEAREQPRQPQTVPSGEGGGERRCRTCGTKLSGYNPGPNCWQHTIGYPWRGPTAKPKF